MHEHYIVAQHSSEFYPLARKDDTKKLRKILFATKIRYYMVKNPT